MGGALGLGLAIGGLLSPLTEKLFGSSDSGVQAPPVQHSQTLPVISSTDSDSKKKTVAKRSGRRQTLITRENQLGAGDMKKKSLLG